MGNGKKKGPDGGKKKKGKAEAISFQKVKSFVGQSS